MKKSVSPRRHSKHKKNNTQFKIITFFIALALLAAAVVLIILDSFSGGSGRSESLSGSDDIKLEPGEQSSSQDEPVFKDGYIASYGNTVNMIDENYQTVETLVRGTRVSYAPEASGHPENYFRVRSENGNDGYVLSDCITDSPDSAVLEKTVFVRTAQNLRGSDGFTLGTLAEKGAELKISGFDSLREDGSVNMYLVSYNGEEGYIRSEYVTGSSDDANSNYDETGTYQVHAARENRYGGGDAAGLDYYPREKASFENNVMPEECRTLYLCGSAVKSVDSYIEFAKTTGINAFVVDITDGTAVSYPSPVMQKYSPSAYSHASNTFEEYQVAVKKLKDSGYYVIGRITVFNDSNLVADRPECAITDSSGNPMNLWNCYWPSAYDRSVWQYKVELAAEAAESMGFNEIQFDYVRFPDRTISYENAGTINYNNKYNETKAQAIQRFLMYACDILHESNVYVSADVFGEAAYNYVTAYGQYWPAISNVVDVISGMPYPDHFAANGDYLPWTHPYDTLYNWGSAAAVRQSETASPAVVRTWIQAYNAIKAPYNAYTAHEVSEEIRGLRDAGLSAGYMTWNGSSSLEKYRQLAEAFNF